MNFLTEQLLTQFDPTTGTIKGMSPAIERRLSDLSGVFADQAAYEVALAKEDVLIYTTHCVRPAEGEGDMLYCIGKFMPGRIGSEYYMTKGHIHSWQAAAEFYIGLSGEGMMLLEDEATGESRLVPLLTNCATYVPGHTAHRTFNTGEVPLIYLSITFAKAGHDYESILERGNFRKVVVAVDGQPTMVDRETFINSLAKS